MDLFKELIPSLTQGRESILEDEKDYVPYVINKALSGYLDCILYVNELNRNYHIDRKMQYDYLFHVIRKQKRPFSPWLKQQKNDDLMAIKEYFGYSIQKAKEINNILTSQQVKDIVAKVKSKEK